MRTVRSPTGGHLCHRCSIDNPSRTLYASIFDPQPITSRLHTKNWAAIWDQTRALSRDLARYRTTRPWAAGASRYHAAPPLRRAAPETRALSGLRCPTRVWNLCADWPFTCMDQPGCPEQLFGSLAPPPPPCKLHAQDSSNYQCTYWTAAQSSWHSHARPVPMLHVVPELAPACARLPVGGVPSQQVEVNGQ